jgi:hypothetical protein
MLAVRFMPAESLNGMAGITRISLVFNERSQLRVEFPIPI